MENGRIAQLDWLMYFKNVFEPNGMSITGDEMVFVHHTAYIKDMLKIITNTSKRTLANYFLWAVTRDYADYLSKEFSDARFGFTKFLSGVSLQTQRWKKCVEVCRNYMGMALASKFVKEKLKTNTKREVENMVSEIKDVFTQNLADVKWMDEKTKKYAKDKAAAMTGNIAYPSFILDADMLSKKYSKVNMMQNLYFENVLSLRLNEKLRNVRKLRRPVDREEWLLPPTVVNAFYDRARNKMVLFAGILQLPLFDSAIPMSLNYGGIGTVMGHELIHGFDVQGRLFDPNGDKNDWWTAESSDNFDRKSRCIANQYSTYSLYGHKLNGNLTLSENIADNGGIRIAFRAYKHWLATKGRDTKLPGVNYTSQQAFFLNFAQTWCSLERPDNAGLNIQMAVHSPGMFRVIGTLSNTKEFADAFKCRLGSRMNPQNKCQVW